MNITDAVRSIITPHINDATYPLFTPFSENLDSEHLLEEYPRPQLKRDSYINLNGIWEYSITKMEVSQCPDEFDGTILVPFSPEAPLSRVGRTLLPDEYLWYRLVLPRLSAENIAAGNRLILHFGAVDYYSEVYVNGSLAYKHSGGYLPFECDITSFLQTDSNILTLKVSDPTDASYHTRGKQTLKRGGIYYTCQSGIWQTVWMEWVPDTYVKRMKITPDFDSREVFLTLYVSHHAAVNVTVYEGEKPIARQEHLPPITYSESGEETPFISEDTGYKIKLSLPIPKVHPWSPEDPFLYTLGITLGSDRVESYFAMRSFTTEKDSHDIPRFCLNHKPYFLNGVLDQGYWPDGLYTAPSDEALLFDIVTMKNLGFNMLRKHLKVESARWYYHCDRLGMIVCQDMINGGKVYHMPWISYLPTLFPHLFRTTRDFHYFLLSRTDKTGRYEWTQEMLKMQKALYNVPSIAIWVPFNEGWGQFDAVKITRLLRKRDTTRLIDSASGWFDQGCGHFLSIHNYFRPLTVPTFKNTGGFPWKNRAYFLSEFGGFACHIKGHSFVERIFGYKRYDTDEEFSNAFYHLMEEEMSPLIEQGLSGAVYTQLCDVEEEVNGILTYDRRVNKLTRNPIKNADA